MWTFRFQPSCTAFQCLFVRSNFFLNIQNNFNFVFLKKYDNNFLNFFTAPDDPEPIDVDSIPKKDGEKQIERARHPASAQQVAGEKTF